jgi:hypothetical protein
MTALTESSIAAKDLLDEIEQDVFRLGYVWTSFRFLYAGEKKNVDVLNAVGSGFFVMVQRLMYDDAILRVAKLTDPAGNRHQENVSLERLLLATNWETTDPAKWQKFRALLDRTEASCEPCRKHRHKRISHKDLSVFQQAFASLPNTTIKMIDDARTAIHDFIQEIRLEFGGGQLSFEVAGADDDVDRLMRHLINRASQKHPDAICVLAYEAGSHSAEFHCAFCGEKEPTQYYPDSVPSPEEMIRWHYATCHGVIGCEQIIVNTFDMTRTEAGRRFVIDLIDKVDP